MKKLLLLSLVLSSLVNALELTSGQTVSFTLALETATTNVYIDVPANATTLKVEIENGITTGSDFDLLMKYDSDFTTADIYEEAQYLSGSLGSEESFTISTALNIPLREGRWYISVYRYDGNESSINLTATYDTQPLTSPEIQFIFDQDTIIGTTEPCDIAGWNDPTPVSPVSGNNARTRGQQRKNAVLKAAELMTQNLQSTVPLIIQGCWPDDLETSATSAVLANAGARTFVNNTSGLLPDTWYPIALAERQAGTQACKLIGGSCETHSILINFNPKIDTSAGLGNTHWYYGLDTPSLGVNVDFVSTALHEMTHGLGFSSAIYVGDEDTTYQCPDGTPNGTPITHTNGTMFCNKIDIFSSFLLEHNQDGTTTPLSEMATDALREHAITNAGNLLWSSVDSAASEFNTLSNLRTGLIQLYAPSTIEPGSSVSHLSRAYSELMEPIQDENLRDLQLATPMLWDIGWDPRPKTSVQETIKPGLYSDIAKNGHGFVIEPIQQATGVVYFTVFYTYRSDGTPEWYTAISKLVNNTLVPINTNTALQRFTYDFTSNSNTPFTADDIGTTDFKVDFNSATTSSHSSCNDGKSRGNDLAVVSWTIGSDSGNWCIESIENTIGAPPTNDFGAQWWAGETDQGWGLSLSFAEHNSVAVATLYYFDSEGKPRWVQGSNQNFSIGQEIIFTMNEVTGYPRAGTPPETFTLSNAGTLSLTLNSKNGNDFNDGSLTVNVNYLGAEGGNWSRTNLPITLLTTAH